MSLIGPKAPRLLEMAGLRGDLPPRALHHGAVEGASTVLLRAGTDHWLLLLDGAFAAEACHALLEAGRPVGLSLVGCDAVGRLAAAARPAAVL